MASLTSLDNINLALFISHQKKIFRRNQLLKGASHIGSHTITRIWRCTDEYTYCDPVKLDPHNELIYEHEENVKHEDWLKDVQEIADMAIVTDWYFDKTGCNTISCNPYYPGKGICKGFDGEPVNQKEAPFAFTTGYNQRVDACQPICYDEDQIKNTYVGMMSLYAAKNHMCYVTNPELIAFYLDPHRRVIDEKEGKIEKSAFKIGLEYLGPTGVPAILAKIGEEYCEQYGLDYIEENNEIDDYMDGNTVRGCCKVDKNEGAFTALSTWTGDTVTRAYNFGRAAFKSLIKETSTVIKKEPPPMKGPTTVNYLADEEKWRSNVDKTKKQLPFPLKLTDLGLQGISDGLMWTDEYSFIDDGRNDKYGGRLIEKPKSITRPPWSIIKFDETTLKGPSKDLINRTKRQVGIKKLPATEQHNISIHAETNNEASGTSFSINKDSERKLLLGLGRNVEEYKRTMLTLNSLKDSVAGSSYEIITNQIIAGTTVETLGDIFKQFGGKPVESSSIVKRAIESMMRWRGGSAVSTKSIGVAMTQTAIRTGIETHVVTTSASLLKLSFRALSRGANILTLISIFGAALDLFTAFIYNPYSKYEHYMSDRLLRAMAEAELITTQRLIGCQRLLLEPSDWVVNTRYLDPVMDSAYDMLLGMIYTRARRVNSDGSMIYWFNDGGLRRNNDGQLVYFDKTTEEPIKGESLDRVFNAFNGDRMSNAIVGNTLETNWGKSREPVQNDGHFNDELIQKYSPFSWLVIFSFVLITIMAITGLGKTATRHCIISVGVLALLCRFAFPETTSNLSTKQSGRG